MPRNAQYTRRKSDLSVYTLGLKKLCNQTQSNPLKTPTLCLAILVITLGAVLPLPCRAVPSFARQLNMQCIACHTEFTILNEFGRQFKLGGYTLATGQSAIPPLAVMLQPSFTHTGAGQAGGAMMGLAP